MLTRQIPTRPLPRRVWAPAIALALLLPACQETYVEPDAGVPLASDGAEDGAGTPTNPPIPVEAPLNQLGTAEIGEGNAIEIRVGDDLAFDPTFIRARAGEAVSVTLTNEGFEDHTFTIDEGELEGEEIDVTLQQDDDELQVEFLMPTDGEVRFHCRIHERSGMKGAFFTDAATGASTEGG